MNKKICFIMCTNNSQYEAEAMYFISRLKVPNGCETDVISVKDAHSLASGYNEAMRASDAKYKIYMHQDVMLIEPNLIKNLLEIFENPDIGMIGMVGTPKLPENKVPFYAPRVGKIYTSNINANVESDFSQVPEPYVEVEAVDGLFMATQYDIPWREDIFDKWDFYDASQSQEFIRAGKKVVVPHMEKPWCIHDDGVINLGNYFEERKKFVGEYF